MSSVQKTTVRIDVLTCHQDPRGYVYEPVPGDELQNFLNVHIVISEPGAIRGNHFHVRGTELAAVRGPTLVRFRENDQIRDVAVPEDEVWRFCFPPGVPHAFLNTGDRPSMIASFNTEEHDRDAPDVVVELLIQA